MLSLLAVMLLAQAPEVVPGARFEKGNKPSGLMPEHLRIKVGDYGKLDAVSVPAWEKLFAAEPQVAEACVTRPVAALKKLLQAKALPPAGKGLPALGCPDGAAAFTVQARRVRAGKIDGVLYVTQQLIEDVLTSNEGLQAWFEGLSDDGKTYAVATFKVKAKGLRDQGGPLVRDRDAYQTQLAEDAKLLAGLKSDDFTPSLDALAAALAKVQLTVK